MAGFCVGVVERDHIINGKAIQPGDVVLGLASTGLHSNGYSLVRKVVFEHAGLKVGDFVPELGRTVGEELLEPTRIYVRAVKNILRALSGQEAAWCAAWPTSPAKAWRATCRACCRRAGACSCTGGSWPMPPVFRWLQRLGNIEQAEMETVFNLGIGFVMIVSQYYAESIQRQLEEDRVPTYVIGEVREGEAGVEYC